VRTARERHKPQVHRHQHLEEGEGFLPPAPPPPPRTPPATRQKRADLESLVEYLKWELAGELKVGCCNLNSCSNSLV